MLTKDQAIALFDSKFWESMTMRERAEFQMLQDRLCMPFDVFQEALGETLGRPVFTHEFGLNRDGLMDELFNNGPAPSMDDILNMIPADKRIIVSI